MRHPHSGPAPGDRRGPVHGEVESPGPGHEADGIKAALGLLWARWQEVPGAFPVLAVHDEIVVECDEGPALLVTAWLKTAMLDGMTPLVAPVPVEVEVRISRTWGGE